MNLLERMLQQAKAKPMSEAQQRQYMRETADGYQRLLMRHGTELARLGRAASMQYALAKVIDWQLSDAQGTATFEAWVEVTDAASAACADARSALRPERKVS